jgi:hypothetical protein
MAERESDEDEIQDRLMRFRLMETETTDPIAMRFLHDIVLDLEAELDRRSSGQPSRSLDHQLP